MPEDLTWGGAAAVPTAAELAQQRATAAKALAPTDSGFCAAYSTAYRDTLQEGATRETQLVALTAKPPPPDADTGACGNDPGPEAPAASKDSNAAVASHAAATSLHVCPCFLGCWSACGLMLQAESALLHAHLNMPTGSSAFTLLSGMTSVSTTVEY